MQLRLWVFAMPRNPTGDITGPHQPISVGFQKLIQIVNNGKLKQPNNLTNKPTLSPIIYIYYRMWTLLLTKLSKQIFRPPIKRTQLTEITVSSWEQPKQLRRIKKAPGGFTVNYTKKEQEN